MFEDAVVHSRETRQLLDNHVSLTEVKLTNMEKSISRIESALKWAGGLIVSLLLTVLGWAVIQQINANESQKNELRQQQILLQQQLQQEEERVESATRAAEAAAAANGAGQIRNFDNRGGTVNGR
jgi:hypothetical protein